MATNLKGKGKFASLLLLHGDICRGELLVEIDGVQSA